MLLQFLLILPSLLSQGMHSYSSNYHLQVFVLSSPFSSPQSLLSCPFFCLAPTGEHIPPPHVTTFLQTVSELLTSTNFHSRSFHQSSANILWGSGKNLWGMGKKRQNVEVPAPGPSSHASSSSRSTLELLHFLWVSRNAAREVGPSCPTPKLILTELAFCVSS